MTDLTFRHIELSFDGKEIVVFQRSIHPELEQDQEVRIQLHQAVMVAKWIMATAKSEPGNK